MFGRQHTPLAAHDIDPQTCTIDLRLHVLRQAPFFAALSLEELAQVNPYFHERGYEPGETVYTAGTPAEWLCVVATGRVKIVRPTPQGQNVLLDIVTPGEFFGSLSVLGDREYRDSAEAQTMCCVLSVAAADFQAILHRYPPVTLAVLDLVAARLAEAHELVEQYSTQPVERRIAAVLLKLGEKLGEQREDDVLIQMPLSRQDLAEMAGTTVETASRVMSQFRKDGLVRSGRRWVALVDRKRLVAVSTYSG